MRETTKMTKNTGRPLSETCTQFMVVVAMANGRDKHICWRDGEKKENIFR